MFNSKPNYLDLPSPGMIDFELSTFDCIVYSQFNYFRSFYKNQDKLIDQYAEIRMDIEDAMENAESVKKLRKKASNYAKATFAANVVTRIYFYKNICNAINII